MPTTPHFGPSFFKNKSKLNICPFKIEYMPILGHDFSKFPKIEYIAIIIFNGTEIIDMFLFFWHSPEMAEFCLGWVLHPANSLENLLNRQEIEWRVCRKKNLTKNSIRRRS